MGALEIIGQVFSECWEFLTDTTFTVSGITFSLANVFEVAVVISLAGMLISIFIVNEGGDWVDGD